jgi:hypothetical protein
VPSRPAALATALGSAIADNVGSALDRSRDRFRGTDAASVGVAVLVVAGVAVGTGLGIGETLAGEVLPAIAAAGEALLVASVVTITLQWIGGGGGLEATHDLDRGPTGAVAGVFAVVAFVLAAA